MKEKPKVFYKSKTLWVNIIAIIAMLVQAKYGFIISLDEQLAALAIVNLILRAFTHGGLELRES
jgi:uncharacterized membrane protein